MPSPFLNPNGLVNKFISGKNKHFSSMDQGARLKNMKNPSMDRMGKLFNHSSTLQSNDSDRLNAMVKGLPLEENAEQLTPDIESQSAVSSSVASEFLPKLAPENQLCLKSQGSYFSEDDSADDNAG